MSWKRIFVGLQIEFARQERPGSPGRSAFSGPKGALTHHPQAGGGIPPVGRARALSEGDYAFCGKRPPMPSGIDGATGKATPVSSLVACENPPPAAFRSLRGTKDERQETRDGGNQNWRFIIWRQRLLAGGRAVPLWRHQLIKLFPDV